MIYFIQAKGTDLVKIGFTAGNPERRLKELQTGCPHSLQLLATIDGDEADESRWHLDFATDRVNGEWFNLTQRILVAICKATLQRSVPATKSSKRPKAAAQLYAFALGEDGYLAWSGKVVRESETSLRLELFDAILGYLSGELKDLPRSSCRIFTDIDSFNEAMKGQCERLRDRFHNKPQIQGVA